MNLKEFRELTKDLPDEFELACSGAMTESVTLLAYGERLGRGHVAYGKRRDEKSTIVILVSESDERDFVDDDDDEDGCDCCDDCGMTNSNSGHCSHCCYDSEG